MSLVKGHSESSFIARNVAEAWRVRMNVLALTTLPELLLMSKRGYPIKKRRNEDPVFRSHRLSIRGSIKTRGARLGYGEFGKTNKHVGHRIYE